MGSHLVDVHQVAFVDAQGTRALLPLLSSRGADITRHVLQIFLPLTQSGPPSFSWILCSQAAGLTFSPGLVPLSLSLSVSLSLSLSLSIYIYIIYLSLSHTRALSF